jgi:ATP-dependent Clp protease ATP-binding subunit ClpA
LAPQKISVTLTDEAKQVLIDNGYDPKMGARPMRRIVQKTVENLVAKEVLSGNAEAGTQITLDAEQIKSQLD